MNFPQAGELHRRAGWQAALQDEPVGCTVSWVAGKGRPEGCPFLQPAGPPFCAARPFVFCGARQPAESSRFSFGNTVFQPAQPSN